MIRVLIDTHVLLWLFHLKIGLFTDNDGNCVAFSGSANETHGLDFTAFAAELLKPYLGARQPPGAAGLEVHEPAAPYLAPHEQAAEGCRAPRNSHLWPHQLAAIAAWNAVGQVGLLEMCTGAGKTVTALEIVKRELQCGSIVPIENLSSLDRDDRATSSRATSDFVVIVCPTKILVEQWAS